MFSAIFAKVDNFCGLCLLPWITKHFQNWVYSKVKNLLPKDQVLIVDGGKSNSGRVASPEHMKIVV